MNRSQALPPGANLGAELVKAYGPMHVSTKRFLLIDI